MASDNEAASCAESMHPGTDRSRSTLRKLLERNALNCESCGNLFQTSVFSVRKVGIVCVDCMHEHDWEGHRLKIFDMILEDLAVVSCTNTGCSAHILEGDQECHLENCMYRPVECPVQGCRWKDKQDDLTDHFVTKHHEEVVKNKSFTFDLNLAEASFFLFKLFIVKSLKYFFIFKREPKCEDIFYNLYKVDKGDPRIATIKYFGENNLNFTSDVSTISLNMLDKQCYFKSDIGILKTISGQTNKNTLSVTVEIPTSIAEQVLECPGCLETMKPPIYLCSKGHSFCSICSTKYSSCSKCRSEIITEARNTSLETLTADLLYSCINEKTGCKARILGKNLENHESECPHTTYSCPFDQCPYKNTYHNFKQHVKDQHSVLLVNSFQKSIKRKNESLETVHMCVDNCIFKIIIGHGDKCPNCKVDLLSEIRNFLKYICIISIRDSKTFRKLVFHSSLTQSSKTTKADFTKGVLDFNFPDVVDFDICVKIFESHY